MTDNTMIGGASVAELKAAADSGAGAISDTDPIPWDAEWQNRFHDWNNTKGLCILIFDEKPKITALEKGCVLPVYQIGVSPTRPENGVYIVGKAASGNGWLLPNTAEIYQRNCEQIVSSNLDHKPTIVIGLHENDILFLPNGINESGLTIASSNAGSPFEEAILTDQLNHFAEVNLAKDVRQTLWVDPDKYWAIKDAEAKIQFCLLISFRQVFRGYMVQSEVDVALGRIDIYIAPGEHKTKVGQSVLELKVLREFGSTGKKRSEQQLKDHLKGGVGQAAFYVKNATLRFLCAYDMRKNHDEDIYSECIDHCEKTSIKLMRFPVYNSDASAREALLKTALA